ncbi:MAG TPA: hypothetical protein V6C96_03770, partial [Vampirovibrionales bacterium]
KNMIDFSGGTGKAPQVSLKMVAGVPGESQSRKNSPKSGIDIKNKLINDNGYARFVIVGDLDENSVDATTEGDWSGDFTVLIAIP